MIQVGVEALRKAAQAEGFPHAGTGGEDTDPPGIFQVIQALGHLGHVTGKEPVFFLYHLLVKGVEGKAIISKGHQFPPPIRE